MFLSARADASPAAPRRESPRSSAMAATAPSDDAASATAGPPARGANPATSMYLWSDATEAATKPHPLVHSAWPGFTSEPRVASRDVRRRHADAGGVPAAAEAEAEPARSHETRHAWSTSLAPAVSRVYDGGGGDV